MQRIALGLVLTVFLIFTAGNTSAFEDGTAEITNPAQVTTGNPSNPRHAALNAVILNPIESACINASQVWRDNRHRAYWSTSLLNVNGFLLFDVSSIPDGATITSMSLLCYLENAFGSPLDNPVVAVYYSADDGWTRASVGPGALSLDVLLLDNVQFTVYVPTYDFVLDHTAHDWSGDLADDRICIGFTNTNTHYSFVYFFGAGGTPTGPPPELTIEFEEATPVEASTWGAVKAVFD